jgi:hypothetical protein
MAYPALTAGRRQRTRVHENRIADHSPVIGIKPFAEVLDNPKQERLAPKPDES